MNENVKTPGEEISLEQLDTHKLADAILKCASESRNEEELKMAVEKLIDPIIRGWGIKASYEHKTRHEISGIRKDALYGHVIIEYKKPGELDSKSKFIEFKEKVKEYIIKEAVDPKYFGRWFGIIIDGYKISFIRFRKNEWEEQDEPLKVNAQTVLRLLESIRGLRRKPIDAEFLLLDFGPKSEISKKVILTFYNSLVGKIKPRTNMLFNDWKRVFSQVCSYSPDKLAGLVEYYDLADRKKVDVEKLLYAIHTYYTILMKLLTSEIVTLFADSLLGSYLKRLEEAYYRSQKEMFEELKDLEEGGIFATLGIRNFLEADYFGWYLDEWNEKIAESIFELTKRLLDYEPATVELNPERVKDLFKRLYQNLVPRDIRHKLGEYFTPDWLAELLLNEVGYDGNPDKRILDPACGSGTFLVLAIKRIKEYAEEHFIDERTLINKIIENVRGIDLNPLAVLASKANYLIALSDLLRYRPKEGIEIPIYLADSISVIRKVTPYGEYEFELHTNEGKFWITKEVIDKNYLYSVLSTISEGIKIGWTKEEFEKLLSKKIPLSQQSVKSFIRLYDKILELERYGKNRIWTQLLKNSFSPMLIGKFDYVVGNPPWINWENLPEFYRNSTKELWDNYGLLEKTKGMGLGKVKRDIAMLFVARCFDQYVNDGGKLAFLIPFTTYKTQAGAGFRSWLANKCQVEKIHDLVTLYPFEGAINRTSLIVIKRGQTKFPIPCVMWYNPKSSGIDMEAELEEVKKTTKQFDMIFTPVKKGKPETPWMMITEKAKKAIENIIGESPWYKAYEGINTALNSVYWIDILSKQPNGLLIVPTKVSGQKKKVKEIKTILKPDLIYPLIRGRDVKRWFIESHSNYIILPTNENGETLKHDELKVKHPKEYEYFLNFIKDLTNRGGEPYKSKLEPYRKKPINRAEKEAPPFYWLFNVSPSLAKYKVVWKRIAGGITGKAVSFASAVIEPVKDKYLEEFKPVVLNDSLILIPFDKGDEAYYVSGVLNSSPVLFTIASYTYELRMETHITQYIKIPKFNPKDKLHIKLSELSKKAHELAKKYYEQNDLVAQAELKKVEEEIDKTVAKLYGITDEELEEIKKTLKILKEGEVGEEEESEEEEIVLPKGKDIEVKVEPLFIKENESQKLDCMVFNNSNNPLSNIKVNVYLDSKSLDSGEIKKIDKNSSKTISFNSPKLKSGEYELRIILDISGNKIEEKRKLFVGREKKERKVKSELDKEIEKILG
jgi:methylase of polypeptide subunit release factors